MAAKERADLLRSARRKILQNSICRQSGQTEIEFCKNFCRVLPLQGLAAKAGSPLQSRHQWERAGWNRRRCLPWRPDSQPLRQRCDGSWMRLCLSLCRPLPSPPFPHDHPARALRGADVIASARRSTAGVGTGVRRAAGPICRVSARMEVFETGIIFRIGPGRRPGSEDGKRTIFLRNDTGEAERTGRARGRFLTGCGKPRRSSQRDAGVLSAGGGRARRPPNRRFIARWRDDAPHRSCAPQSAPPDPGRHCAASHANREGFGA
jgi:hypothetical protein